MAEYTAPEVLEVILELFAQDQALVNEFGKIELVGLPQDPIDAILFCICQLFACVKQHEQFSQLIGRQGRSASEIECDGTLDPIDQNEKSISNKMKSLVKMINVPVPKFSGKKADFYTQNSGSTRPVQSKSMKSSNSAQSLPLGSTRSTRGKFPEPENDTDSLLNQPEMTPRSSIGSYSDIAPIDEPEDDIGSDRQPKPANTPKRAAKLARFFGLQASEDNIEKIRSELRLQSNINFYKGCMGENVIRIYIGPTQWVSYKSLLITNLTPVEDCIKILLAKLDIANNPSNYSLIEISQNKESRKVLQPTDYPLQIMQKWNEKKTIHLMKNTSTEEFEDVEGSKKGSTKGKLTDVFGVGITELENATLIKALDQLEPSGTFFELPEFDPERQETLEALESLEFKENFLETPEAREAREIREIQEMIDAGINQNGRFGDERPKEKKRVKSRRETGTVMVKVHLPNRTHQKLTISPTSTIFDTNKLMSEQIGVSNVNHAIFELKESGEEVLLEGDQVTWQLVTSWGEKSKLLFKKLPDVPETEAPKDDSDDEISVFSVDGEVVIFFNENSYETLSIDGETATKTVLETIIPKIKDDISNIDKYVLQEVKEDGQTRNLPLDECPLITKLNSLEQFRFVLKKKDEEEIKENTPPPTSRPTPLESMDEKQDSKDIASKRTMKLAGFFGVDKSKTEVDMMHQLLGSDASELRVKRKTMMRKDLYHEGWLQVRRDFEELGKARWQQCWCIFRKGELVISLGQASREQSVSSTGPNVSFQIRGAIISSLSGPKKYAFKIQERNKGIDFDFAAASVQEQNEWMNKLKVGARTKRNNSKVIVPVQRNKKSLEDFEFLKVIGRGHFGKVLLCAEKETGEVYAIKVLKKTKFMSQKDVRNVQSERRIMKGLHHPFIVGLHFAFQSEDRLYLVMEYVNGGELFFHLSKDGYFKESRAKYYAAEILLAVNYLHKQGIIYRDLKLENILMDKHGHMKITDFGLCKADLGVGVQTTTLCGTTEYMAPEVLLNISYGFPVDWWSFGIVLYEMLCGTHPFYSQNRDQMFYNVLHSELRYPNWISDDAIDLLEGLLERNPALRIGSGPQDGVEIMRHPFFKSIDFALLEEKKIPPPFKPNISGEKDISNIDVEFTKENPVLTPIDKSILMDSSQFRGFSMDE